MGGLSGFQNCVSSSGNTSCARLAFKQDVRNNFNTPNSMDLARFKEHFPTVHDAVVLREFLSQQRDSVSISVLIFVFGPPPILLPIPGLPKTSTFPSAQGLSWFGLSGDPKPKTLNPPKSLNPKALQPEAPKPENPRHTAIFDLPYIDRQTERGVGR